MARDAENVLKNHSTHGWTQFEGHPELGFINIIWLEWYCEKCKAIVCKRIEDTAERGDTYPQLGSAWWEGRNRPKQKRYCAYPKPHAQTSELASIQISIDNTSIREWFFIDRN